jgi:hypothetical protein
VIRSGLLFFSSYFSHLPIIPKKLHFSEDPASNYPVLRVNSTIFEVKCGFLTFIAGAGI